MSFSKLSLPALQVLFCGIILFFPPVDGLSPAFASDANFPANQVQPASAPPDLSTDEAKLKYLLWIQERIHGIFRQATNYKRDLFDLLDSQARLYKQLEQSGDYLKLDRLRPALVNIKITVGSSGQGVAKAADSAGIEALRNELASTLQEHSEHGDLTHSVLTRIRTDFRTFQTGSAQGMLTGLVKSLPKERRSAVFRLPPEEQYSVLSKELPDNLIQAGFRGGNIGLNPEQTTKESVMAVLREKISAENRLSRNLILLATLSDERGALPPDLEHAQAKLSALRFEDLENWQSRIELPAVLLKELNDPSARRSASEWINGNVGKRLRSFVTASAGKVPVGSVSAPNSIVLEELPPEMGIFKGCIAGDCSTQHSFAYPWSPKERVFVVKDGQGGIKGYESMTELNAGGKKSLYINGIAGVRISHQDAEDIVHGLYQIRGQLGVEEIHLPVGNQVSQLFNYAQVYQFASKAVEGKPMVPVIYEDVPLRNMFAPYIKWNYDSPEGNTHAAQFEPTGYGLSRVHATISPSGPSAYIPKQAIDRKAALMMAAEFQTGNQPEISKRIVAVLGIPDGKYQPLADALMNTQNKTVDEFVDTLKQAFGALGIHVDDAFLNERPHLLFNGVLKAPDFAEPANLAYVLKSLPIALDPEQPMYTIALNTLGTHGKSMAENRRFQAVIAKFADRMVPGNKDYTVKPVQIKTLSDQGVIPNLHELVTRWLSDADPNPAIAKSARLRGLAMLRELGPKACAQFYANELTVFLSTPQTETVTLEALNLVSTLPEAMLVHFSAPLVAISHAESPAIRAATTPILAKIPAAAQFPNPALAEEGDCVIRKFAHVPMDPDPPQAHPAGL